MLTAQITPDAGAIHVNGVHVAPNKLDSIAKIGYCPQFDDLLLPKMSVVDHLRFFCAMNGINPTQAEEYIAILLNSLGILSFKDVFCGNLSGGTKRKVSAAIAIMLPRQLVILDEASSGLDPLARQKLWNTVSLLNKDRTTVITTHYIDETSFCDKIAIMVNGNLKACDTEHALSKKFAKGYTLSLNFTTPAKNFEEFCRGYIFEKHDRLDIVVENVLGNVVICRFTGMGNMIF